MNKNIKKIIFSIIAFVIILLPKNTYAINASLSCSSSGSVSLNNTITVTISGSASESAIWTGLLRYDASKLSLISGDERPWQESQSFSSTYTFRAISEGSSSVWLDGVSVSDVNGNDEKTISSSACNINVVASTSSSSNSSNNNSSSKKSSDNSLKSLSIEGATLSPEFDSGTLEYSVELPNDTTKIVINAEKNDSDASISGDGEKEVTNGLNKFEVVVTAENGATRTYVINVTVEEKDPIKIKVNGSKSVLLRKVTGIEIPVGFEETTIKINGEEIQAFRNKKLGYLLVGILDSNKKVALYIYDENKLTYTKYNELSSNNLRLILLDAKKKDIPHRYRKSIFKINDEDINGYSLSENSRFRLIYALNVDTMEENFYLYDLDEHTFQRFYDEQVLIYISLVKKIKIGIVILAGILAVLCMMIVSLLIVNVKTKKRINKFSEATIPLNPKKEEEKKDKKSKKKKEKTFIDE